MCICFTWKWGIHHNSLLVVCKHGADLDLLHHTKPVVRVPPAQNAIHVAPFEILFGIFVMGAHDAILLNEAYRCSIIPYEDIHTDTLARLVLKQLTERETLCALDRTVGITNKLDLSIYGPSRDIDEVFSTTNSLVDVFPTTMEFVELAIAEVDFGVESVRNMRVLVEGELTARVLLEESVRNTRVFVVDTTTTIERVG